MSNFLLAVAVTIVEIVLALVYFSKQKIIEIRSLNWKQRAVLLAVSATSLLINVLLFRTGYEIYRIINIITVYGILLVLSGNDYYRHEIPNKIILFGFGFRAVTLMIEAVISPDTIVESLIFSALGLLVCFLLMLFISFITKHGIGYGDVKMIAWLGFCVGMIDVYYISFYGVLIAAIFGGILILSKKYDKKTRIPFAPFIWLGFSIVYIITFVQG